MALLLCPTCARPIIRLSSQTLDYPLAARGHQPQALRDMRSCKARNPLNCVDVHPRIPHGPPQHRKDAEVERLILLHNESSCAPEIVIREVGSPCRSSGVPDSKAVPNRTGYGHEIPPSSPAGNLAMPSKLVWCSATLRSTLHG